jgi:hypothetical protein
LRRGHSQATVAKIISGNIMRVMAAAEATAAALAAASTLPGETVIFPDVPCRSDF